MAKVTPLVCKRTGYNWRKCLWIAAAVAGALVLLDFMEEPTQAVLVRPRTITNGQHISPDKQLTECVFIFVLQSRGAGLSRHVQNLKSLRLTVSISPESPPDSKASERVITELEEKPVVTPTESTPIDTRTTIAKRCSRDPFDVFLKAERKLKIAQQLSVENGIPVDQAAAEVAPQALRSSWVWRASESLK